MSLNCSEISTYKKIHFELKNVQNVLGILLKTIQKSETIVSIKTSIPKIAECYTFLIHCLGIFGGKNKYWKYIWKYIMWSFQGWIGSFTIMTGFYGNSSIKIMQNYQHFYPQKGNDNLPWCCGNGERVIPIYGSRHMEYRNIGILEYWNIGISEDWKIERVGRLEDRNIGRSEDWRIRRLEDWKIGRLEYWKIRKSQDHKIARSQVCGRLQVCVRSDI